MSFSQDYLSFTVVDLNDCKLLGILDTSSYANPDTVEGKILQVQPPNSLPVVELNYYQDAITILNSNSLKITNVSNPTFYQALPDGLYTAKISICPFEDNWFEKSWYRTCQLECKFQKAFIKLNLSSCTSCWNKQDEEILRKVWVYLQGIYGNVTEGNFKKASDLYTIANKMLDNLRDCDDCDGK